MNPAALYSYRSDVHVAAFVPGAFIGPAHVEEGGISAKIWDVTTYADVFALRLSLRRASVARHEVLFSLEMADGVSISIGYGSGASGIARLGSRGVNDGVAVAVMDCLVTEKRIDAQMAVSPLPGPGQVDVLLTMGDGLMLGEILLSGDRILEASRYVRQRDLA